MIGATKSKLAISMPVSVITRVNISAGVGSPLKLRLNILVNGSNPSFDIACNNLGAPIIHKQIKL